MSGYLPQRSQWGVKNQSNRRAIALIFGMLGGTADVIAFVIVKSLAKGFRSSDTSNFAILVGLSGYPCNGISTIVIHCD